MAMTLEIFDADAEAAAEQTVLEALQTHPRYPIEIKPDTGQSAEEIKHAVERCEAIGWIQTGPAAHCDPRSHLTEVGEAELASRQG